MAVIPSFRGISIHAPPRGATFRLSFVLVASRISIHAPPRGATVTVQGGLISWRVFQFTPLREGRRTDGALTERACHFNSRPSARGDRNGRCLNFKALRISIHAPPRGATGKSTAGRLPPAFQFTPLREGRQGAALFNRSHDISIHAPPRGATARLASVRNDAPNFNSRPSARGDADLEAIENGGKKFQFTPLREGRPPRSRKATPTAIFQFTPLREGRPNAGLKIINPDMISIHAPPRGAT